MKEKLKKIVNMVKEKGTNGLEKARSSGTAKKVVTVVGAFLTVVIVLIVCVKALSYLMTSVYNFVDTHFFWSGRISGRNLISGIAAQRENDKAEEA